MSPEKPPRDIEPFDPHSVASDVSVREQQVNEEMRELLAKGGVIPLESVPETGGVNIDDVRVPQYQAPKIMQREMDRLTVPVETTDRAETPVEEEIEPREIHADFGKAAESASEIFERTKVKSEDGETFKPWRAKLRDMNSRPEEPVSLPDVFHSNRQPRVFPSGRHPLSIEKPEVVTVPETLVANREDAIDQEHVEELFPEDHTPKEWRDRLRGLIEGTKGKIDRWKSPEEHLIRRSQELDTQLENIGGIEKKFRWLGERYTKYGWKTKLAVGVGLGLGFGAAASFASLPAALACFVGIATQRTAGMATMFLKYEKEREGQKWGREKAMGKAMLYTAAMTGSMLLLSEGVKETIGYAREHDWAGTTTEWLKQHWPFSHTGGVSHEAVDMPPLTAQDAAHYTAENGGMALPSDVMNAAHETNVQGWTQIHPGQPYPGDAAAGKAIHEYLASHAPNAAPASAAEAAADGNIIAPQMPTVGASSHGYEGMLKELWNKVHEPSFRAPHNLDPKSDLAQLLHADKSSLDTLVHNLAANGDSHGVQGHHFFTEGSSVRIDSDAQMTIGADGQVHLSMGGHNFVDAPLNAPVTHAPVFETAAPSPIAHEAPLPPAVEVSQPTVAHLDVTHNVGAEQPPAPVSDATFTTVHHEGVLQDSSGNTVLDSSGNAVHTGSYEAPPAPPVEHVVPVEHSVSTEHVATPGPSGIEHITAFTNPHDTLIDPNKPLLYTMQMPNGGTHLVAYGGTDEARFNFIQKYLATTKDKNISIRWAYTVRSIFGGSTRVEDLSPAPEGSGGAFIVHSHFIQPKAPNPDDFTGIISAGDNGK